MEWMAWTLPTALFFGAIALLIGGFSVWGTLSPSVPRRGLLPMATTRGDRLFIALVATGYINVAWVGLTNASQWIALAISLPFTIAIGRWG